MRAVDTNVLVRLITRDDPRQMSAAETFIDKGAWVSPLALAEAVWELASVYELDAEKQAKAVAMLLDHVQLVLHERESVAAASICFARSHLSAFQTASCSRRRLRLDIFPWEPSTEILERSTARKLSRRVLNTADHGRRNRLLHV